MTIVGPNETKRIHSHKFFLWAAMGSICMMFAAFTSAYIVKRNQSQWLDFDLPKVFWFSTVIIILSSIAVHLALKKIRANDINKYKLLIAATAVLGVVFCVLQFFGFSELNNSGIQLFGAGSNAAASFLGVIVGFHVLHVLAGVIAILIISFRSLSNKKTNINVVTIEMMSTYWHFVDVLWIYLFVFFMWIR
ncbi:cytochrome c oxidase subunit 3 [mine drainage metagenome]|uniref:Cytochrome c oxidase subunit 3 n=1 Tax=mine drainage metagenome TaxID=410659 RepID=A0A1J5SN52_9ZZZZ